MNGERRRGEVQQAAGGLLLGATADELEGERIETATHRAHHPQHRAGRPTNPRYRARAQINCRSIRRPLSPLLSDLDREMWRLFQSGQVPIPRLHVERLRPPAPTLPDEVCAELLRTRAPRRPGLTDDGWAHSDVEPLARIALGRAALADGPLEQAVIATVYDYLMCADTLGQARDGYAGRLAHRLGAGAMLPDPDAAKRQQQQLIERRVSRELECALDRNQRVEERGRLEQMLSEVIDKLDLRRLKDCSPRQRVAARGLAEHLREVRSEVTAARAWEALRAAESQGRDPLTRAGELLEQIKLERTPGSRSPPVPRPFGAAADPS